MMSRNTLFLVAGIALFIAMARLPYGYYQLLRFFVCGTSVYAAYLSYNENKLKWAWTFGSIAILFNPFFKIHFEKELWRIIDLMAGLLFCFYFALQIRQKKR